jgi:hypothetical protein
LPSKTVNLLSSIGWILFVSLLASPPPMVEHRRGRKRRSLEKYGGNIVSSFKHFIYLNSLLPHWASISMLKKNLFNSFSIS